MKNNINNDIIFKKIILLLIILLFLINTIYIFLLNHHVNKKNENNYINNIYNLNIKANDNFVFLGDSITAGYKLNEFFEDIPIVNSGVNGYKTYDVLNDIEKIVYQYNPTKVFILIGINDILSGEDKNKIYSRIVKIINNIKKNRPLCDIYIESIYPVRSGNNDTNKVIDEINSMIENKYKNKKVTYININKYLKDKEGKLKEEYTEDGIHLKSLAYLKITKYLLPYLNE